MPSISFFPSSESQKRWIKHMTYNYIENQYIGPCVFQVPDNLRDSKPEAYIPQVVGLGPYHHFRPEVQLMSSKKRAAVKDYSKKHFKIGDFRVFFDLVKNSNEEFEHIIRSCYDLYLDLDKQTLSWIVIVDGIVLLHFIDTYLGQDAEKHRIYSDVEKLVPDVLMLENQIPIILLLKMRVVLGLTSDEATDSDLDDKFYRFCSKLSPLELTNVPESKQEAYDENNHLLHFMYQMIMKNKRPDNDQHSSEYQSDEGTSDGANGGASKNRVGVLAQVAADHVGEFWDHVVGEFNSALEKAQNAGVKVPGNIQKVSQLLQKFQETFLLQHNKEAFPGDKIEIPSVSRLVAILKIEFKPLPSGCGIRDIDLKSTPEGRKYNFYLPVIHMHPRSEVILRNLVAYEATISKQQQGSTLLRDYVDLMCGLIKSEKDVQLLKNAKIIKGELPNEQIVEICNGIQKSDEKPHDKSKVHKTVKDANDQFNNSRYVKCWRRFMKFVAFMVKNFGALFPFLIFILLSIQSGCQIFDCRVRPNGGAAMQNLHFVSSLESDPQAKFMLPRKFLPY